MLWFIVIAIFFIDDAAGSRYIRVENRNKFPIWIQTLTNNNGPPLCQNVTRIRPGARIKYNIPDSGWAGRFWAKYGCDRHGNNCAFGQSMTPCPKNGCQPPADTKLEFFFPPINSPQESYYDISLVRNTFTKQHNPYIWAFSQFQ